MLAASGLRARPSTWLHLPLAPMSPTRRIQLRTKPGFTGGLGSGLAIVIRRSSISPQEPLRAGVCNTERANDIVGKRLTHRLSARAPRMEASGQLQLSNGLPSAIFSEPRDNRRSVSRPNGKMIVDAKTNHIGCHKHLLTGGLSSVIVRLFSKIDIKVFELGRPVRCQHRFDSAADYVA